MKKISTEESKKIMINILNYLDDVCRRNNIKYTLVGGSLIGAIRHKGIIPWDDDIDVGLLPEEYNKLMKCLKNGNNGKYKLLDIDTEKTYYYPFAKLVDTDTICNEIYLKKINNYGVFIDIFKYNNIPSDLNDIKRYYNITMKIRKQLYKAIQIDSKNFFKKIFHKFFGNLITIKTTRKITKKYIKYTEKYNNRKCKNVMINWTPYGAERETHLKTSFDSYIDAKFENIKVMIIKDYNRVLTNIFGDYMTPPPKEKQKSEHNLEAFWK